MTTKLEQPSLGSILGVENTYGALDGRTPAGPLTYGRITTADAEGKTQYRNQFIPCRSRRASGKGKTGNSSTDIFTEGETSGGNLWFPRLWEFHNKARWNSETRISLIIEA